MQIEVIITEVIIVANVKNKTDLQNIKQGNLCIYNRIRQSATLLINEFIQKTSHSSTALIW